MLFRSLTPKGFTEKYHKSVHYTLKTIRSIGLIREQLNIVIGRLYAQGERFFAIFGNSDLAELVEMSLRQPQWVDVRFSRVERLPEHCEGVIFICREEIGSLPSASVRYIDLIKELASQKNKELVER